jgi:3'-phosphoadenosine 5'-phosphosulfate sulfotransferase (PAPS reductase)/FAD synthetase
MNTCRDCGSELSEINIYLFDHRYCVPCGIKHHNFIQGRKNKLKLLRALPLSIKVKLSSRLIKEAIDEFGIDHVYISYSGGKDSTVLSHIAKQLYPNILHLFANTTNEYPETLQHVKWEKSNNKTNIITVFPIDSKGNLWTFKKVVDYYGFPIFSKRISNAIRTYQHAQTEFTKQNSIIYLQRNFKKYLPYIDLPISDKCCDKLKKEPLKRKAKELNLNCSIIGILASESYQRENEWINYGCNVFFIKSDNQCRPLSFWTEHDILNYIEENNIKISPLYSKGYKRNGCMYCGFGVHLEKTAQNRYEKLKTTHPTKYDYLVFNFGYILCECNIRF